MGFDLDEAIKLANQLTLTQANRHLTDIEILILKGAWNREEYDQIAAKHQYATSYISQDVAPKLWKLLTDALGERVKKSNFKEALKRGWQRQSAAQPETEPLEPPMVGATERLGAAPLQGGSAAAIAGSTKLDKRNLPAPELYVERHPVDSLCYEALLQPGALIRVKAPKLMGKTTLVMRVRAQLMAQNYRTVYLSLELADRQTHFTQLNRFLRWFCLNISRELALPNRLNDYWDEEGIGSKVSCTTYFEEYLLPQTNRPLVLCLDDVDLLFPHPEVYEDFFGLLRSWYEKARSRQVWKKLRLVIVHATDVYIRLNINQSPFNVGLPIELPEFTPEQIRDLAQQHELAEVEMLTEALMAWVGGHPYLLNQAMSHLKSYPQVSLSQLLAEAPTEAGIYRNHLREYWLSLQQEPSLMKAFETVVTATGPVRLEIISAYQLQSMGLVKLSGNEVEPRCRLYRSYFSDRLKTQG